MTSIYIDNRREFYKRFLGNRSKIICIIDRLSNEYIAIDIKTGTIIYKGYELKYYEGKQLELCYTGCKFGEGNIELRYDESCGKNQLVKTLLYREETLNSIIDIQM